MTRAALLLLGLCVPATALAQSSPLLPEVPERRLVINNLLVTRLNPLGLELQTRGGYQRQLYRKEGLLFRDNFLFVGAYPKLNPAGIKVGPVVEIQPLSIFNLRLSAEYVGFFGTMGFLQSRPSPNADYSDTALDAGKAAGLNTSASGARLAIEPFVQMKVGPIAVRNRFAAEYWNMGLRGEDRVWYDATLDTLVPGKGFTLSNDLDVLFLGLPPLVVGARYSLVEPLYASRNLAANEPLTVDNGHHRVGLLAAYVFYDEGYTAFNKPAVLLNVAWYVQHRFRTGADVNRAMPYLLLGFAFQSDLLDGQ
ncbi:hypothetical protein [Hyalangium rubrum]|uniref:Uncharacterized protein n=1 Tax=Hyalangium rubrum TaxID=3103134 RepID=A0ABU5HII6_9BACT|nr:hypothetical protein [Hyalangium sp. s54d21]MDY7233254.1 hypothetical protein [Hyalangium sp. s54d21]